MQLPLLFLFGSISCFNAEKEFVSQIDKHKIRENLKFYTARAHPASSIADYDQVQLDF